MSGIYNYLRSIAPALRGRRTILLMLLCVCCMGWAAIGMPRSACASINLPDGTCTTDPQFNIESPLTGDGILSVIVDNMRCVLYGTNGNGDCPNTGVVQATFEGIAGDSGYLTMLRAALTLSLIVYAVMFTLGMVHLTLQDFVSRMMKITLMAFLSTAQGWLLFSNYVIPFFNGGRDEIITYVVQIAIPDVPNLNPQYPFALLDGVIMTAVSAKMAVTIMAVFLTGPYGVIYGLLILTGLGSFFKAVIHAIWVYLMSLMMNAFLFGLAPLFLVTVLFTRTRHIFDGWLNQVLNASLQPILLFTFFSFFTVLIGVSIDNIITTPVCWTEWSESFRGTPFAEHYWRFAIKNSDEQWEPYSGAWDFTGAQADPTLMFPLNIVNIMIFVLMASMAGRFNYVVIEIAKSLAAASTDLSHGESISDWFSGGRGNKFSNTSGFNWGNFAGRAKVPPAPKPKPRPKLQNPPPVPGK